MYPRHPPNAGHIVNGDWLVGLFSAISLEDHMNGMLLGQKQLDVAAGGQTRGRKITRTAWVSV